MTPLCPNPRKLRVGTRWRATCCDEHFWLRIVSDENGWHVVPELVPAKGRTA